VEGLLHAFNMGNWSFVQSADLPLPRHSEPSSSSSPPPSPSLPHDNDFLSVVLSSDVLEHQPDSLFSSQASLTSYKLSSSSSSSTFLSSSSLSTVSHSSSSSSTSALTSESESKEERDEGKKEIPRNPRKGGRGGGDKVLM